MSETHCRTIGRLEVCVDADGAASIECLDWEPSWLPIPEQDVPAVALALLGGLSDDLVERGARHYWETWHSAPWEECVNQEDWRITARTILQAAFGLTEETE